MATTTITLKLTSAELESLDTIVERSKALSRSQAIRSALHVYAVRFRCSIPETVGLDTERMNRLPKRTTSPTRSARNKRGVPSKR